MQHVCQGCNKVFESPYRTAKYCCRSCYHKQRLPIKDRICRTCGEQLESPGQIKLCYCCTACRDADPSRIVIDGMVHTVCYHCEKQFTHPNWRTLDYCSQSCAKLSQRTVSMVTSTCTGCGKTFEHHSNRKRRFCTKDCWYSFGTGENNPCWNSVEVECANCHKIFFREAKHATKNAHNFCSSKCNGEYYSSIRVGENHPLWRGGIKYYRGPNWSKQRDKARKRDGYRCQHCGKTEKQLGKKLHVHHIVPFREFGYIRNVNSNYLDANELCNLISLCDRCHKLAEHGLITFQLPLI